MTLLCRHKRLHLEKNIFDFEKIHSRKSDLIKNSIKNVLIIQSKNNPSPFKKYFSKKMVSFSKAISVSSKAKSSKTLLANPYYCPGLFKIFICKFDILPLWTGILIHQTVNNKYRVNNNPVENYFNNIRNNVLGISKKLHYKTRLFPSEMLSLTYKWMNAKFNEFYEKDYRELNQTKVKCVGSKQSKECWSTKNVGRSEESKTKM